LHRRGSGPILLVVRPIGGTRACEHDRARAAIRRISVEAGKEERVGLASLPELWRTREHERRVHSQAMVSERASGDEDPALPLHDMQQELVKM